ncbi:Bro-N domain-containing protein [Candidatus Woesearchaeota archaeon]|nr:Bro-N domain-containing protein [Candidatus Woesearchaeota archaeon]
MKTDNIHNALVVFEGKQIRRVWVDNQWFFSVIDIIRVLTESVDAKDYWYRLKQREQETSDVQLSTICRQLKLLAEDGKLRETDCANTKNMFRIIQSVPSPKAEPFTIQKFRDTVAEIVLKPLLPFAEERQ